MRPCAIGFTKKSAHDFLALFVRLASPGLGVSARSLVQRAEIDAHFTVRPLRQDVLPVVPHHGNWASSAAVGVPMTAEPAEAWERAKSSDNLPAGCCACGQCTWPPLP
jgi:hypothetical protein